LVFGFAAGTPLSSSDILTVITLPLKVSPFKVDTIFLASGKLYISKKA